MRQFKQGKPGGEEYRGKACGLLYRQLCGSGKDLVTLHHDLGRVAVETGHGDDLGARWQISDTWADGSDATGHFKAGCYGKADGIRPGAWQSSFWASL